MRIYIAAFLLFSFITLGTMGFSANIAQATKNYNSSISNTVNVGLLPTNPFYFLKNWKRSVLMFFTFNPIAKAELELEFFDQKAVELEKLQEIRPDDDRGISKALRNYQESHEYLKVRLETLGQDSLLEKLADQVIEHEELIGDIAQKLEDRKEEPKEPRPAVVPLASPSASSCAVWKQDLVTLDELLKSEKISKYEYDIQYATIRDELSECKQENAKR